MEKFFKLIHWVIILYAAWNCYVIFSEKEEEISNLENQIPPINMQITKTKKEIKQIRSYFKDIEDAKKKIEFVAMEVEKIQKKLPNIIDDTENLGLVKGVAEKLNLKQIFLSPGIEENKGFYYIKKYELSARGTYLQFLMLFERIANSEKLLNIKNVEFGQVAEKQRGRFQLIDGRVIIEAYRYNDRYKEDRGIKEIEDSFKNKKPVIRKKKKK